MDQAKELIGYCRNNRRVCPKPMRWNTLFEILLTDLDAESEDHPSAPLILSAWWETPALAKMIVLDGQIHWAAAHGKLDRVDSYIRSLSEQDWHHLGD